MRNKFFSVCPLLAWLFCCHASAEYAQLGAPLKQRYHSPVEPASTLYQTKETFSSYSMECDMGNAIPDPKKGDAWYVNKPVPGLKLELRAVAAMKDYNGKNKPIGFVVITKGGEILKTFRPIGDQIGEVWDGDVFNSWSADATDIKVFSERFGRSGYAYFDLLDGQGFYYKTENNKEPDYFLTNCRRIQAPALPVYELEFDEPLFSPKS